MTRDSLYELAFRYKKTKLWKHLFDDQIFALRTEGGETAFICVMGYLGEHIAISVFPEEDFPTYYSYLDADSDIIAERHHDIFEKVIGASCFQCSFEDKDFLYPDELEEARAFAKSRGIRFSGSNAFPKFSRFTPYHHPWHVTSEGDTELLAAGLEVSTALSGLLKQDPSFMAKLPGIGDGTATLEVPLFVRAEEGWKAEGSVPLPGRRPVPLPRGTFDNEGILKKIRAKRKGGAVGCRVTWMNSPIQESPDVVPYYPAILMAVDQTAGKALGAFVVGDYGTGRNDLLKSFMETLAGLKKRPEKVYAQTERTYALLADTMEKVSVDIEIRPDQPLLDEALYSLQKDIYEGEGGGGTQGFDASDDIPGLAGDLAQMLDQMEYLDDRSLRTMPEELKIYLEVMADAPGLPSGLKKRIESLLDRMKKPSRGRASAGKGSRGGRKTGKKKKPEEPLSYVISVSPYTGCYRHIRVSADITLETLHEYIQDVFDFDSDHMYAFFMDNRAWSDADAYYAPYGAEEEDERSASDYRLRELDLYRGKKFLYIFDFGDDWRFRCSVLRVEEGDTDDYQILRAKGDLPEQYPYLYDDDKYYDEEDDF